MNYRGALLGAAVALRAEGTHCVFFPLPLQEELKAQDIKFSEVEAAYGQYLLTCFASAALLQSTEQLEALGLKPHQLEVALILSELCKPLSSNITVNTQNQE